MTDRYSRWQDALTTQSGLLDWTLSTPGLMFLQGFFAQMNSKRPHDAMDVITLGRIQVQSLREGEPTYVSHDACELVEHAMETFRPQPVLPADPWVPNGFALLAKPLYLLDHPVTPDTPYSSPTGQVPVRAISWMSLHNEDATEGCFWVSYYTDIDDEFAHYREHGIEHPWEDAVYEHPLHRLSLVHQWQWTWGRAINDPFYSAVVGSHENADEVAARAHAQASMLQTLWALGSQFVPAKERAPRGIWRDANRKGLDRKDVTIIRLRRAREAQEHEPTGRTFGVQFLVRGYWATRHTREGARQVWVRPHIKGPEDAPMHLTDRAWEFTR